LSGGIQKDIGQKDIGQKDIGTRVTRSFGPP
jgi:hypothetical protein